MPEMPFRIETDGDEGDMPWWPQWTRDHFPSYVMFWVERIVPLTYRVRSDGTLSLASGQPPPPTPHIGFTTPAHAPICIPEWSVIDVGPPKGTPSVGVSPPARSWRR